MNKYNDDNNNIVKPLRYENKPEKNIQRDKSMIDMLSEINGDIEISKKGSKISIAVENENSYSAITKIEEEHYRELNISEVDKNLSSKERIQQVIEYNKKMTQKEIADKSGTSQGYVSKVLKKNKK